MGAYELTKSTAANIALAIAGADVLFISFLFAVVL